MGARSRARVRFRVPSISGLFNFKWRLNGVFKTLMEPGYVAWENTTEFLSMITDDDHVIGATGGMLRYASIAACRHAGNARPTPRACSRA
jgi:hypothetical protein